MYVLHCRSSIPGEGKIFFPRYSSVGVVNELWAGRSGFDFQQGRIFLSATTSRLVLGPIKPPVHWVSGSFLGGKAAAACS
jgi:hypothetical protein